MVVVVVMVLLDEVLCSELTAGAVGSSVSRRAISRSRRTSVSFESIRLKRLQNSLKMHISLMLNTNELVNSPVQRRQMCKRKVEMRMEAKQSNLTEVDCI